MDLQKAMSKDWRELHEFWFGTEHIDTRTYLKERMAQWFSKNAKLDQEIKTRFTPLLDAYKAGELEHWKETPQGFVTLIVLLDQIPRNSFRNSPRMHETDTAALELAKAATAMGMERTLSLSETLFLLLPYEHSERLQDQKRSVQHFTALAERAPKDVKNFFLETLGYAKRHLEPIALFGRFPHRNSYLGRTSTIEELDYLRDPAHSF